MASTIKGTISEHVQAATASTGFLDGTHTTTADTDLLLCFIGLEGAESMDPAGSQVVFDISGTPQELTLISSTGVATSSDVRTLVYGLVSPGAVTTANCRTNWEFSANQVVSVWMNLGGTATASVAAATNQIDTTQHTGETTATELTSGGSTGNSLIAWGVAMGNDMNPSSVSDGFTEQVEGVTGATVSDFAYNLSTLLSGGPSGTTITWATSAQNSGNLIEIITSDGGIGAQAMHHYRNHAKVF
jgi:hypothetical protein